MRNPDAPHIKPLKVLLFPMRANSAKYARIEVIPHPIDTPKKRDATKALSGRAAAISASDENRRSEKLTDTWKTLQMRLFA
jgi:hypothetical protein